jgi:hypothetical protein
MPIQSHYLGSVLARLGFSVRTDRGVPRRKNRSKKVRNERAIIFNRREKRVGSYLRLPCLILCRVVGEAD